ncbi:pseudouridine synthase [Chelatococcus reniformis]|uniref:Pseudouridine synthase n=1 Tax=Chelatococcus reniformis TaxID=1494448 RepID=A0A916XE85_9HYPH|nr:pseudouridine synthase [Chelatococcus reniformis]GGC67400.1 pseudouridine synthase [Chelatococcus reniformis]
MSDRTDKDRPARKGPPSKNRDDRRGPPRRPQGAAEGSGRLPAGKKPQRRPKSEQPQRDDGRERIAKVIARAGVASRRDAEDMIAAARVTLNGGTVQSPAINVGPGDRITIDGQALPARERTRLWLYHKPAGLVTTKHDPEGRPTVFSRLPPDLPRVISIGRLDINTEGLLLLTNDGGLARVLAHPDTGWLRRYRVRAFGSVGADALERLSQGITVDGMHYGPIQASIQRQQGDNIWLMIGLREGKNREVKRVLEHLGLQVNRLIRLSFGPFQLGDMADGAVEEISTRVLRDQLGEELAQRAGVDFASPLQEREPAAAPQRPAQRASPRPRSAGADAPAEGRREDGRGRPRGERAAGSRERDGFGPGRPRRADEPGAARGAPQQASTAPSRRHPLEPKNSIWRDDEAELARGSGTRKPRRGEDPKAARTESATRGHVRAGRVARPDGRTVLVERVVAAEPAKKTQDKRERQPRNAHRAGALPDRVTRRPAPERSGESPRGRSGGRDGGRRSEGFREQYRDGSRGAEDRPTAGGRERRDEPARQDKRPAAGRSERGGRPKPGWSADRPQPSGAPGRGPTRPGARSPGSFREGEPRPGASRSGPPRGAGGPRSGPRRDGPPGRHRDGPRSPRTAPGRGPKPGPRSGPRRP